MTLTKKGYDVLSVQDALAKGRSDQEFLAFATQEGRALVTYNIVDFEALARDWMTKGKEHYGIILVHEKSISQRQPSPLIRALATLCNRSPSPRSLFSQTIFLTSEEV